MKFLQQRKKKLLNSQLSSSYRDDAEKKTIYNIAHNEAV